MKRFIMERVRGPWWPYLQAVALLLIVVGVACAGLAAAGCDGCDSKKKPTTTTTSPSVTQTTEVPKSTTSLSVGRPYGLGNGKLRLGFQGQTAGPPYPATATVSWTPPAGATDIHVDYPNDPQPQISGPPTVYTWSNVPVDQGNGQTPPFIVDYGCGAGTSFAEASQNTVTMSAGGEQTTSSVGIHVSDSQAQTEDQSPAAIAPAATSVATPASYYTWHIWQWIGADGITLTTELCQQWTDFVQQDAAFVALRFPVYPPTLDAGEPYTLPVVFRGVYSPTLALIKEPTPILTLPLEYRPQRFAFLENVLPAAAGEHWLALGAVISPTAACPADLNARFWHLEPDFHLDFGGAQNTFADRVLPIYYCYEGQSPPAALAAAGRLLGIKATTYQGWGITCLGPHPLRLHGDPPMPGFEIGSTHTGWITPTQPITLSHYVLNLSNAPVTLTLSYSSSLDLPWGIYSGTWQAPTLPLVPITEPLRLKAPTGGMRDVRTFWLIGSAPAGTPAGAETLIITARDVTSPTRSVWTSDLVWVGDWVAPPTPVHWRALHLPLLLRQSP